MFAHFFIYESIFGITKTYMLEPEFCSSSAHGSSNRLSLLQENSEKIFESPEKLVCVSNK
jgi:hypothetical protein